MVFDFRDLEAKKVEHMRDGEGHVFTKRVDQEGMGGITINTIPPGFSIGLHQHTTNFEVCYIISGKAYEVSPEEKALLEPGMVAYCPNMGSHSLVNEFDEDFVFFGVLPDVK